jgi:6-phosphogluconolactonase
MHTGAQSCAASSAKAGAQREFFVPINLFTGSLTRPMPQYGAANGRGITQLRFDETSGALSAVGETRDTDDTAWLVPTSTHLYSTFEKTGANQSSVAAYAIDPVSGGLTLLNTQSTGGGEACHGSLSIDGRFLLVANYNGATPAGDPDQSIAVFPIATDGSLRPAVSHVRHQGSGPNAARQTAAHAHCVIPSPDGRFVYVADLGIDRIVAYELGADGSLTAAPSRDVSVPPGVGPRHLVFHPSGKLLFMVSELIPTVMSFSVDPASGALTETDSFAIAPPSSSIVQPAGILLTPDAGHLLVGLRVSNEILSLYVGPTGKLTHAGRWSSGGATPRDFALSPSGKHLVVANQDSDLVTVFGLTNGQLSAPLQQLPVGTPMSIKFAV